jgi:hypothetical protein
MLESLQSFLLFGSFVWFWIITGILLICLFLSDIEEQGYAATTSLIIFLGLNYFWGNLDISQFFNFKLIGIYLLIGLIYSFIKTYFYARKKGEDGREYIKENVFRWWGLWPISLINWILSDIIRDLYNLIYDKLSNLYNGIFNLGLKSNGEKTNS